HSECAPRSPPSPACTACRAPAPEEPRPRAPGAPVSPVWQYGASPYALSAGFAVLLLMLLSLASSSDSPSRSSFAARFLASVPLSFPSTSTSVALLPALDNKLVGALVVPGLFAQRRESPGRLRMIALDAPFTAAVRMIHGVHGYAADRGPDAPPTRAPGLSEGFILMVEIAHLANRGHAIHGKFANFAGRQLYESDLAFLAQQLRRAACRTNDLSAAPGVEL